MSCKPPAPDPASSCRSIKDEKRWSPAAIVRHYDANHFHSFNEHIAFYKRCDLETCLKLAPLGQTDARNSRGNLKRHSHQSCLVTTSVDAFRGLLLKNKESLRTCRSFSELLDRIEKIAKDPKCSGKSGRWSLSPAFDMTYSFQPGGRWTSSHQMTLNGKRDGFVLEDFKRCAEGVSMKRGRAKTIIDEVRRVVRNWRDYADEARVLPEHRDKIQATLRLDPFE